MGGWGTEEEYQLFKRFQELEKFRSIGILELLKKEAELRKLRELENVYVHQGPRVDARGSAVGRGVAGKKQSFVGKVLRSLSKRLKVLVAPRRN